MTKSTVRHVALLALALALAVALVAVVAVAEGEGEAGDGRVPIERVPEPVGSFFSAPRAEREMEAVWTASEDSKYAAGAWRVSAGGGMVALNKATHHALSAPVEHDAGAEGGLVVQYQVKARDGLTCSGAYLKLLASYEGGGAAVNNETPYSVMFGPDKCGETNRVHFIFRHPVRGGEDGELEEKHMTSPPRVPGDRMTHLYTLVVRPNNEFVVKVDNREVRSGSLLEFGDFEPSVNPPEEIEDPEDAKPGDWVDEPEMDDPEAVKPDDWVDGPEVIPDPDAEEPDDWDEESDGEWEAPEVPNPDYVGPWRARRVPNPDYKGPWSPRRIPNPDYKDLDLEPWRFAPIKGVAFELWMMDENVEFGHVYVGSSEDEADAYAKATFERVQAHEKRAAEEAAQQSSKGYLESPVVWVGIGVVAVLIVLFAVSQLCAADVEPTADDDDDDDDIATAAGASGRPTRKAANRIISQDVAAKLAAVAESATLDDDDMDDLAASLGDDEDDEDDVDDGEDDGAESDGDSSFVIRKRRSKKD